MISGLDRLMSINDVVGFGHKTDKSIVVYTRIKKISSKTKLEISNVIEPLGYEYEIAYHGKISPL